MEKYADFVEYQLVEDPATVGVGWVLIDQFYKDIEKMSFTELPVFVPENDRWSNGGNGEVIQTKSCDVSHALKVPVFLFGKRENRKLEELNECIQKLRAELEGSKTIKDTMEKEIEEMNKEIGDLSKQINRKTKDFESLSERSREDRERRETLEEHMSLVVAEIGEGKWREIIERK